MDRGVLIGQWPAARVVKHLQRPPVWLNSLQNPSWRPRLRLPSLQHKGPMDEGGGGAWVMTHQEVGEGGLAWSSMQHAGVCSRWWGGGGGEGARVD